MAKSSGFLGKHHADKTREKIQVTQIVNRLNGYALGKDDTKGNPIVMDAGQLRAAEVLLRKSLPDLSSVTIGGNSDEPVVFTWQD